MKILFIGDIVGNIGRQMLKNYLPTIRKEQNIDMVIANGENAAGGKGLTFSTYNEIIDSGVDLITMGNHVWDNKDIFKFIDNSQIIRPLNYPPGTPGNGSTILYHKGINIAVINCSGRVYMEYLDCPFRAIDRELEKISNKADIILVDFHGEATSEKVAMGYHLDGRVSAVLGTHTHVQTADEKILPKGTGYITDVGMTGPSNSILGMDIDIILKRFKSQLPHRFEVAKGKGQINGIIMEFKDNILSSIYRYNVIE